MAPERKILVEDLWQADWLRVGPRAVEELLISHGTDNPCLVARQMRDNGQGSAPIFRSLVEACKARKAGRLAEWLAEGKK